VAIQKWVGNGARITGDPAPVNVSDLHMGLYVESISDSPSTAAAGFDNFTAAQL
jgi:hypothetical protein